jgi:hypothetical protein
MSRTRRSCAHTLGQQSERDRSGLPAVMLSLVFPQEERHLVADARRRMRKAAEELVLPDERRVDAVLQGGVRRAAWARGRRRASAHSCAVSRTGTPPRTVAGRCATSSPGRNHRRTTALWRRRVRCAGRPFILSRVVRGRQSRSKFDVTPAVAADVCIMLDEFGTMAAFLHSISQMLSLDTGWTGPHE